MKTIVRLLTEIYRKNYFEAHAAKFKVAQNFRFFAVSPTPNISFETREIGP